ncbi:MAG TPA: autotransporter domain-containing protein, partial [Gammaproteobacteria bacterium]|nr:autotransporter domain-containing protein [Gammaproteobacteria bacterium]
MPAVPVLGGVLPRESLDPCVPNRALARRAAAAGALLGLVTALSPVHVHAAITLLADSSTHVQVQPGEIVKVRNDGFIPDLATTDRPPLRVTGASYNFQGVTVPLTFTPDLCVAMFDDPDLGFGGVATISLRDDSGATANVQITVDQGGNGVDAADCRDPALVVKQPTYPATAQVAEEGNVLLTTASLLAVARDPNGGQVLWDTPSVPPSQGTVAIEGTPGAPGGIRFTAARDFNGVATITYLVTDSDNDGVVPFQAEVTVTPVNDPPTATESNCTAAATGGSICQLDFDDVDTPRANLTVTVTGQPTGGAVSTVDVANRRVTYTPRPGTTTDSFTYTVSDGGQITASAPVAVTVSAAPSPPQAVLRVLLSSGAIFAETPPNGAVGPVNGPPDSDQAAGEAVRLDGSASLPGTNPTAAITVYHWTVNGQALPQTTATVDLRLPDGPSTITLQVEDANQRVSDAASRATASLNVGAAPVTPVEAPQIFFNGSAAINSINVPNNDFEPGETVLLDASHSASPPENPIVTYTWTLNGKQVQTGSSATASLALADGSNTVLLTVTYQQGNTGTVTLTAVVTADTDLGTLPGLTPSQRSVGTAISELCPRLNGVASTPGQQELLDRCTDILRDTNTDQQRGAIEAITPEEITSQQTTAIDFSKSQAGNLAARLVALRQGAGGVSFAGLSIRDRDGSTIPLEQLAALVKHLAGGASGDDDDAKARDPAADSLAKKWGFFINGNVIDGEKDRTANEAGFDFGGWGITTGFDYRFSQHFVGGLSLGYNESDTDFAGNAGSLDSDGVTTSLYGTYFDDKWYADFIGSSGGLDYDSTRVIAYTDAEGAHNDRALGSTNGDLTTLGVSFGYNFSKGGWSFGPTAALTNVEIDIDGFAETGGGTGNALAMRFGNQTAESRTLQGGFQFGYALSRPWGVLSPQMRVALVKEYENDAEVINVRFVSDPFANDPNQPSPGAITLLTDDPDTSYMRWSVGVSFVRAGGLSAFVNYEAVAGYASLKSGELTF